jgi:hypothetical protein
MRIKEEYKGKTIVKHATVRNITVVVDNIDVSKYKYYVSIGMGYLFENESETTTAPEKCIQYEGIEQEVSAKPIPKRKRRVKPTPGKGEE